MRSVKIPQAKAFTPRQLARLLNGSHRVFGPAAIYLAGEGTYCDGRMLCDVPPAFRGTFLAAFDALSRDDKVRADEQRIPLKEAISAVSRGLPWSFEPLTYVETTHVVTDHVGGVPGRRYVTDDGREVTLDARYVLWIERMHSVVGWMSSGPGRPCVAWDRDHVRVAILSVIA